jgi:hypothetical protein
VCETSFSQSQREKQLKTHLLLRIHTGEKQPYECSQCGGKCFSPHSSAAAAALTSHMRLHNRE